MLEGINGIGGAEIVAEAGEPPNGG